MLSHRLRGWSNIGPTLGQCLVFAGILCSRITHRKADRSRQTHSVGTRHLATNPCDTRDSYAPEKIHNKIITALRQGEITC